MSAPIATATIITPCRNAEGLIARTAGSILNQTAVRSGRLRLRYLVMDGASDDATIEVVREVCGDRAEVVSEPDSGMYEALAKGLGRAEGEIVSYLNAGDAYAPDALDIAADCLEHAAWVTGLAVLEDESGAVLRTRFPWRLRRRYLRKTLLWNPPWFPMTLQQESTFWRRELLETVDLDRLATFRLAGDAYLWKCFAGVTELRVVDAHLGGFTRHQGQLSSDMGAYRRELAGIRDAPDLVDRACGILDQLDYRLLPDKMRRRLARRRTLQRPGSGRAMGNRR